MCGAFSTQVSCQHSITFSWHITLALQLQNTISVSVLQKHQDAKCSFGTSLKGMFFVTFWIRPGIRLLAGSVTDAMEATALTFNMHFIDIYVCSWGPRDDGAEMDGPHSLTARALRQGTHEARLSSPRSHCCLSDGEQSFTLSVGLRVEGENVKCRDYKEGFKYTPIRLYKKSRLLSCRCFRLERDLLIMIINLIKMWI